MILAVSVLAAESGPEAGIYLPIKYLWHLHVLVTKLHMALPRPQRSFQYVATGVLDSYPGLCHP